MIVTNRKSWDTAIKHYIRNGLYNSIPLELQQIIPSSNYYRWLNEPDDKYTGCEVADFIKQELELIKRINSSSKLKKLSEAYIKLSDTFHFILNQTKGIKVKLKEHKDLVVNAIEHVKDYIPTDRALKFFNISRAAYQNYKLQVLTECNSSYFLWCVKKYPQQLLKQEIERIKEYMTRDEYKFWSKASVYYRALRDEQIKFCLSTWYKYCNLLGFNSGRHLQQYKDHEPLESTRPNQYWCSDVTSLKINGKKFFIHLLIDHFSTKILSYRIEEMVSAKAIKEMLTETYKQFSTTVEDITFVTDGGSEFVNHSVNDLVRASDITHIIAQKDIKSSNSMMEAVIKVIKHQFAIPLGFTSEKQLHDAFPNIVDTYNDVRPQRRLNGYTPNEAYNGVTLDYSALTVGFDTQKQFRIEENQKNSCKMCLTI